jgi:hypothetical protein
MWRDLLALVVGSVGVSANSVVSPGGQGDGVFGGALGDEFRIRFDEKRSTGGYHRVRK